MNSRWAKIKVKTKAKSIAASALMLMLFNNSLQAGQFLWPEDVEPTRSARSEISRRARSEVAPPPRRSAPKEVVAVTPDSQTDADFCATCQKPPPNRRIPGQKIAALQKTKPKGPLTEQQLCYGEAIFEAARARTARLYRNRARSPGRCAVGVRGHLGEAGAYNGQSLGGGAIDYASSGKLTALGFTNMMSTYPTPASAPKGAVLVFAGPASANYITNRVESKCSGPRGHRFCTGNGHWAGHITVAGEKVGSKGRWYYTDARTAQPAIRWPQDQQTRRLVGVFVKTSCGPECSPALRRRCGG